MNRFVVTLAFATLLPFGNAHADLLGVAYGVGVRNSKHSNAWLVRYQAPFALPAWPTVASYYEISGADWHNGGSNHALGLGLGARFPLNNRIDFDAMIGGAYVAHEIGNLATNLEFQIRLALVTRLGSWEASVGHTHFSNGNALFRWKEGGNVGENFVTFMIARRF